MNRIKERIKKYVAKPLISTFREYCQVCTPHGFSYLVSSSRTIGKIFWMGVVLASFVGSTYFTMSAVEDWKNDPTLTTINALGIPITSLDHPAITICKPNGIYDVGEYLRAVFNNFQFSCKSDKESESCQAVNLLRSHYTAYSDRNQTKAGHLVSTPHMGIQIICHMNSIMSLFN